nr:hypothetical protein GCM10020093_080240 [Planobispora longispora]
MVLRGDGGGVVSSARRPILGADRVARFLLGVAERFGAADDLRRSTVNGRRGCCASRGASWWA